MQGLKTPMGDEEQSQALSTSGKGAKTRMSPRGLLKDFESTDVTEMKEAMKRLNEKHRQELAEFKAREMESATRELKAREKYDKQRTAEVAAATKVAEMKKQAAKEAQKMLELERRARGVEVQPEKDLRGQRTTQEKVGAGWDFDQGDPEAIRHQQVMQQAEAQLAAARHAASLYASSQQSASQPGRWTPGPSAYASPFQQVMPYSPAQQQIGMYSPAQQQVGMYNTGNQQPGMYSPGQYMGQQQRYSPVAQYQGPKFEFINQGPRHYQVLQVMINKETLDHEVQKARAAEREVAAQATRDAAEAEARQRAYQDRINTLDSLMRAQGYTGPKQ
jgi:hypothetical protein